MRVRRPHTPAHTAAVLAQSLPADLGHVVTQLPPGSVPLPPLDMVDQGVSSSETTHAAKLADKLMTAGGVQWVATYRADAGVYEIVGREGTLRFRRLRTPQGQVVFQIVSLTGKNPVPGTDGRALATLEQEIAAAGGAGRAVASDKATYPDLLRRISQLFDHRRAPDLVYIPFPGGDPNHPGAGSHGVPDITQSRAPLIMAGPGIRRGVEIDQLVRNEDIAPTIAQFLGVRPVVGDNGTGVRRLQLLRFQDGASLAPSIADARAGAAYGAAQRALMFVLDGASQTVLFDELAKGNLPNIARLVNNGVRFKNGALADYPVVTWSNHNSILTGASPGHHGVVNNSWYDRERQREQLVTDGGFRNQFRTARHVSPQVETLYEAVRRSFPRAFTAALNQPAGRGANVSTLDLVGVGHLLTRLPSIVAHYLAGRKTDDPQFQHAQGWRTSFRMDNIGAAIGGALYAGSNAPKLGVFELALTDNQGHHVGPNTPEARAAMRVADRRIGKVLGQLERSGQLHDTMVVVTADHGMEHQWLSGGGGWKKAMAMSGVKAVDSTRFVYIRSMQVAVHGAPRAGVAGTVAVQVVNDDVDATGRRPPVAGAKVTVTDTAGTSWTATTDAHGIARLDVTPAHAGRGALRLKVAHSELTRDARRLDVAP